MMRIFSRFLVLLIGAGLSTMAYSEGFVRPQYQEYQPIESPSPVNNVSYTPPKLTPDIAPIQVPEAPISTPLPNASSAATGQTPNISSPPTFATPLSGTVGY